METLSRLTEQRGPWALLFSSAFLLELTALYFQYGMGLAPCIMCIYQRTAVLGIMMSALLVLIINNGISRFVAYLTWGVSAIWGTLIAVEHVDIQTAANPFFASCEIVPNFPSFMPLHEWIPAFFAATGDCGDIDWQFLTLSMPQWMIVILGFYSVVFVAALFTRLLKHHRF
ncbi:MAG: disulfide bond formation protein DsbB [Aestuariibacter sp.]